MSSSQNLSINWHTTEHTSQQLHGKLSSDTIQGLHILSLSVTELYDFIVDAVESNPLLEIDYVSPLFANDVEIPQTTEGSDEGEGDDAGLDESGLRTSDRTHDEYLLAGRTEFSDRWGSSNNMDEEALQETLRLQLSASHLPALAERMGMAIIECVDDNGYFTENLAALCQRELVPYADGLAALKRIQKFSPAGVGARSVSECLLLQLDHRDPNYFALKQLIIDDIDDIANNRIGKLAKKYKTSTDRILDLRERIQQLNPRPGNGYSPRSDTCYTVPDITVKNNKGTLEITLAGAQGKALKLNEDYLGMLLRDESTTETSRYLAEKRVEAQSIIDSMQHRYQTLYRFAVFLVKTQQSFFLNGPESLQPMTMQRAADALSIHVSTMSRIVKDKHIETPWGIVPIKSLFTPSLNCGDGVSNLQVSSTRVREFLKQVIANERRHDPYSDNQIAELLRKDYGVSISRRTVTKYRNILGIESQMMRRV